MILRIIYLFIYFLPNSHSYKVFSFFNKFIYLFIYFGCVGSSLLRTGFSLAVVSGGYSSLRCAGFSLWWILLLRSMGSRRVGFSSCGTRASIVVARGL